MASLLLQALRRAPRLGDVGVRGDDRPAGQGGLLEVRL